jgi:predicted DNA-binding transcriptional regulator AlpA
LSKHHLDKRAAELIAAGVGEADDLLDTRHLAAWLGMQPNTLEIWRRTNPRKGPPYIKLGRMVRYKRSAVLAWLAQCEQRLDG